MTLNGMHLALLDFDRYRKSAGTETGTGNRFLTGTDTETGTETGIHCRVY